jgi:hypothetical protein
MMVAIGNLRIQYNQCTAEQTYENVLNNVFKVTKSLRVSLVILYLVVRPMEYIGSCDSGNVSYYSGLN